MSDRLTDERLKQIADRTNTMVGAHEFVLLAAECLRLRSRLTRATNLSTAAVRIYDAFQCSVVTVPLRIQLAIDAFGDLLRTEEAPVRTPKEKP